MYSPPSNYPVCMAVFKYLNFLKSFTSAFSWYCRCSVVFLYLSTIFCPQILHVYRFPAVFMHNENCHCLPWLPTLDKEVCCHFCLISKLGNAETLWVAHRLAHRWKEHAKKLQSYSFMWEKEWGIGPPSSNAAAQCQEEGGSIEKYCKIFHLFVCVFFLFGQFLGCCRSLTSLNKTMLINILLFAWSFCGVVRAYNFLICHLADIRSVCFVVVLVGFWNLNRFRVADVQLNL